MRARQTLAHELAGASACCPLAACVCPCLGRAKLLSASLKWLAVKSELSPFSSPALRVTSAASTRVPLARAREAQSVPGTDVLAMEKRPPPRCMRGDNRPSPLVVRAACNSSASREKAHAMRRFSDKA